MINALATVIATALEASRLVDEERIRAIVREEMAAANLARPTAAWLTPPKAARACGASLKRVRAAIAAGQVRTRARNLEPGKAVQLKLEVNVASLEAALSGTAAPPPEKPISLQDRAAQIAARRKGTA